MEASFPLWERLALDRTGAAVNSVYGATDEAYIADIYYAASLLNCYKSSRVLGLENEAETGVSENRRPSVAGRENSYATGRCAVKTQTGAYSLH